jgi:hypothetical protein
VAQESSGLPPIMCDKPDADTSLAYLDAIEWMWHCAGAAADYPLLVVPKFKVVQELTPLEEYGLTFGTTNTTSPPNRIGRATHRCDYCDYMLWRSVASNGSALYINIGHTRLVG